MPRDEIVKLLPSYVGSKSRWLSRVGHLIQNQPIVELFAGSAVISFNLASHALWCEIDAPLCKVLSRFGELEARGLFTQQDYFEKRKDDDWWKYLYQLQRMSFSGVYRHSVKGKYNVPVKKNIDSIDLTDEYERALKRWQDLEPVVINKSYESISVGFIVAWARDVVKVSQTNDVVIILDPPYQGSQAAYNDTFDYDKYWQYVKNLESLGFRLMIFDKACNIVNAGYEVHAVRNMRVNGKHKGTVDGNLEGLSLVNFPVNAKVLD